MQVVEIDLALEFHYVDVTTSVRIKMHSKHVCFVTREINPQHILDAQQNLSGVN